MTPGVITFSMLIDMYCKEGIIKEANDVLKLMIDKGVMPDIITYSSLLDGYCLVGQIGEASKLIDLMVTKGCQTNTVLQHHDQWVLQI